MGVKTAFYSFLLFGKMVRTEGKSHSLNFQRFGVSIVNNNKHPFFKIKNVISNEKRLHFAIALQSDSSEVYRNVAHCNSGKVIAVENSLHSKSSSFIFCSAK